MVEGWTPKPYDGWFHPSQHATWTARQLTYYLTHPGDVLMEQPDLLFVLAVTQGKFWHTFIQKILGDSGLLVSDEVPLMDTRCNRRGHTDGMLRTNELFEFKTASSNVIRLIGDLEGLKKYKPGYYAQTQDYLDMAHRDAMRYLVMELASPFPMVEYVVPADPEFQAAQRAKYAEALSAAQEHRLPEVCCSIYSKEAKACPMKNVCPIGMAS